LDLTETEGLEVYGYVETQTTSRKSHFQALGEWFGFTFAEIDGKIVTKRYEELSPDSNFTQIDADILRAVPEGTTPKPYNLELTLISATEMPREVRFTFSNPDLDYMKETAVAGLNSAIYLTDVIDQSFSIVATQEQARKRAEAKLLKTHAETRLVKFTAMPELAKFTVGDILELRIPTNDQYQTYLEYWIRIDKKSMTLPLGVVEVEGTAIAPYSAGDIETAIETTQTSTISSAQTAFVQAPRNAIAVPIISQPIREADRGRLGVYIAVSPFGNGVAETVALYQEIAEDTYNIREIYEVPSAVGVALEGLGNWATPSSEDTTNYLDVFFFNQQALESVSSGELDRNPQLNLLRVGDEWIQFRTATVQSLSKSSIYRSKYRLTNLRRGKFNTTAAIGSHAENEYCVLNTNNLRFYDLTAADVGEEVTFIAVSGGGNIELSPKATFTFNPISGYTVSNATDDREFDADCTTIDELADVVATIIKDTKI